MDDLIGTSLAKKIANRYGWDKITTATIINWCNTYNIGQKIGGQWKIDREKLLLHLTGKLDEKD
jgi:hypothetical protein